jgi:hypothetical protein
MKQVKFYCPDCDFITNRGSTLKNHLISKKHYVNVNRILLHKCHLCSTQLDNRSNWLRHLREVHEYNTQDLAHLGYYIINLHHKPNYTLTNDE